MPSTNYAYVNGRFVPESEAAVSIFDRGFLYGDGVFETMRVYGGKIFRLAEHMKRMFDGLNCLEIESPLSQEEIRAMLLALIGRNGVSNGLARVYATRGEGEINLHPAEIVHRSLVAVARSREFPPAFAKVITATPRMMADKALSRVKSANRLPYVLARMEARRMGATDALLLNQHGRVVEFTASNLFVVRNGELFTPPVEDGALPGVTRSVVLVLAGEVGIPTHEISFGPELLREADEIFATSSLIEVAPIADCDGRKPPSKTITEDLQQAYRELVSQELSDERDSSRRS